MKEIITSFWFWLLVFAHFGASNGTYLAAKESRYTVTGIISYIVQVAVYVYVIILFWRLSPWYLPLVSLAGILIFSLLATAILGAIRSFLGGIPSDGERLLLNYAGLIALVFAFINLP